MDDLLGERMMDAIYILILAVLAAVTLWLVRALSRLAGGS